MLKPLCNLSSIHVGSSSFCLCCICNFQQVSEAMASFPVPAVCIQACIEEHLQASASSSPLSEQVPLSPKGSLSEKTAFNPKDWFEVAFDGIFSLQNLLKQKLPHGCPKLRGWGGGRRGYQDNFWKMCNRKRFFPQMASLTGSCIQ